MTRTRPPVSDDIPIDPASAAERLANWGFLARCDLPDGPGPASLLVALRACPTYRHYDPERVEYWTSRGGRGIGRAIEFSTPTPLATDYAWGMIRIVDRLDVSNEYLTFGGRLTVDAVDGMKVVVFESPAPILRRGGHSQGWDAAAEHLGAFFGRLKVAIDYVDGFEARCAEAPPTVLYAAFVADTLARFRVSPVLRGTDPEVWVLLVAEGRRLRRDLGTAWRAGEELLEVWRLAA